MTTTAEVREEFALSGEGLDLKRVAAERRLEFDAWLADEIAEAHKAGFIAGGIQVITGAVHG